MLSHYQKGLSPIGVLFVICVFVLLVVSALKLVPHYMTHSTLVRIYQDVNLRLKAEDMSAQEVHSAISRAMAVNSIRDFNVAESTVISREGGRSVVGLDYEVREHLFYNIHAVLVFEYMPE